MPIIEKRDIGNAVPGSSFEGFKERNKANLKTLGWRGDQEAAAGLYAEHELLQAVFTRGLEIQGEHDKKGLVQKLYSQACEMLVGGTLPVKGERETFAKMLRRNPIEAAAQLFSRDQKFSFDVLVANGDELQQHIVCDIDPAGQDRAYVVDKTSEMTARAMALMAPVTGLGRKTTPSYTQHMVYQTSEDAGQFHVFSSQPPTAANQASSPNANTDTNTNTNTTGMTDTMDMPDMDWLQDMSMALDDDMLWMGAWEEETPELIDLVQNRSTLTTETNKNGAPPESTQSAPRCRLQEDLEYLINTLGQSETRLNEQLSSGQRPAVFTEIYRSEHAMEACGFPEGAVIGSQGELLNDVVRDAYDYGPVVPEEPMSPTTMQGMEFIQWPAN